MCVNIYKQKYYVSWKIWKGSLVDIICEKVEIQEEVFKPQLTGYGAFGK